MGATSKIEWTEATWNPTRGCSRVSDGCTNCYAEQFAARFAGPGKPFAGFAERTARGAHWTGRVELVPSALDLPLRWRRPRRVFVNSMSDLFHESLPNGDIAAVFGVMAACPQHTFQVLTKRAERMREWFAWAEETGSPAVKSNPDGTATIRRLRGPGARCGVGGAVLLVAAVRGGAPRYTGWEDPPWPLSNVWLGVSVENQATADERIPHLLATPAAVRAVSYEPALGAVNFAPWLGRGLKPGSGFNGIKWRQFVDDGAYEEHFGRKPPPSSLDQIIVGGESGPGARPFDLAWARSVIAQCRAAGVACFVKQLGSAVSDAVNGIAGATLRVHPDAAALVSQRLRDRKGGDSAEWPEDLRVREFPKESR